MVSIDEIPPLTGEEQNILEDVLGLPDAYYNYASIDLPNYYETSDISNRTLFERL